jgi:xeroderma pigmentosum group C-complementing protein
MSLTPLAIQTSFAMITQRNQPDKGLRGRQFEAALVRLVEWWAEQFRVAHEKGIRHQTYEAAHALLPHISQVAANDPKGKGKARRRESGEGEDIQFESSEMIRSVNSLMKHALMMRGSPDMSAQLFTALCRSLGLPARLVVSIQAVLWRKEKTHKERALDRAIQKSRKSMKEKEELRREAALTAAAARNASGKYWAPEVGRGVGELFSESTASSSKGRAPAEGLTNMSSPSTSADLEPSVPTPGITLRGSRPQGRLLGEASRTCIVVRGVFHYS